MTSIRLTGADRNALLDRYRADPDPQGHLRAHAILLLADDHTWATIAAVLFTSPATIAHWRGSLEHGGAGAVSVRPRRSTCGRGWPRPSAPSPSTAGARPGCQELVTRSPG